MRERQTFEEWQAEFRAACRELGDAIMATPFWKALERFVAWLDVRLRQGAE